MIWLDGPRPHRLDSFDAHASKIVDSLPSGGMTHEA